MTCGWKEHLVRGASLLCVAALVLNAISDDLVNAGRRTTEQQAVKLAICVIV